MNLGDSMGLGLHRMIRLELIETVKEEAEAREEVVETTNL